MLIGCLDFLWAVLVVAGERLWVLVEGRLNERWMKWWLHRGCGRLPSKEVGSVSRFFVISRGCLLRVVQGSGEMRNVAMKKGGLRWFGAFLAIACCVSSIMIDNWGEMVDRGCWEGWIQKERCKGVGSPLEKAVSFFTEPPHTPTPSPSLQMW